MSNVYRIHGARFLRKYTAAEKSSNYAYMADVRKIADTLCKVPWTRVSGDVAATTTIHTEEGLDWNEPERDRFDAAEWCGEHADGFHRAFAQAACYVFKMPTSAIGTAIQKIRVNVTSDPYNPYGARIAAMTSATLEIPMDCQTVREGEVFRAPDENGMGAAPRLYRTNVDGTQTWYANSEIVDLVPGGALTAKQFLFVFVCLENYNRGRDGWVEGSSYIDNDVELTLSAAASDLVEDELNDLSVLPIATVLHMINLESGEDEGTVSVPGKVSSIKPKITFFDDPVYRNDAFILNGEFGVNGIEGVPGLSMYDLNCDLISVAQSSLYPVTDGSARVFSIPGCRLLNQYGLSESICIPYKARNPGASIGGVEIYKSSTGAKMSRLRYGDYTDAIFDDAKTKVKVNLTVPIPGHGNFEFYDDKIVINGPKLVILPFEGGVSAVDWWHYGYQGLVVFGNNKIAGNSAAVKVVFLNGRVCDFGIDLTPDDFKNFQGHYISSDFDGHNNGIFSIPVTNELIDTIISLNYYYNPETGLFSKTESAGLVMTGWSALYGLPAASGYAMALGLTGNFTKIGSCKANGAAIVVLRDSDGSDDTSGDVVCDIIPFDVGKIRNGCFLADGSSVFATGIGTPRLVAEFDE